MHNCPDCDTPLKVRDSRERRIRNEDGETVVYIIRRFVCPSCGAVHAEIPAEILPNYLYKRDILERAIAGDTDGIAADEITIRRWKKHTPDMSVDSDKDGVQ